MAAVYPRALKVFNVFHDYTDIIWAYSVNEIHDEVVAIEQVLGTNPFATTPYTTFAGAIQDLWTNKAPLNHTHTHSNLLNDAIDDDHPLYPRADGSRGFSQPVTGVAGSAANDLVPLSQLQGFGYQNAAQVQTAVNAALGSLMTGAFSGSPLWGSTTTPNWVVRGGAFAGCTDGSGRVTVNFGATYSQCVQAFVCTKIPAPGGQACPPYNWIEAQVTLVGVSPSSAVVQFSHDYSWQPGMWAACTWIAIGI